MENAVARVSTWNCPISEEFDGGSIAWPAAFTTPYATTRSPMPAAMPEVMMPTAKRSVPTTIIHLRLKKSASTPPNGIARPNTSVNALPTSPSWASLTPIPAKSALICGSTALNICRVPWARKYVAARRASRIHL